MKKLFAFLFLITSASSVLSQSVAINTDGTPPHPSAMLDVKSANKGLLIPRTSTTTRLTIPAAKGLMVYDTTTSSFWFNNGSAWTELGSGGGLWLANATHIYNSNSGNVGIGTTTPSYDLHIRRANPSIGLFDEDDNAFSGSLEGDSTNLVINAYRKPVGFSNQAGDVVLQVSQSGPLGIFATAGNVGIGTSSPTGKLHVGSGNVMIGSGTPATKLHIQGNSGELLRLDGSSPQINFITDGNNYGFINMTGDDMKIGTLAANNNGKFIVRTNGGDRLQVDEAGNVCIGTATPASGYRLSINGKAICTELKVQLSANWPDYVFTASHKKLSLAELEAFIARNRHLPNIPAAAHLQRSGLDVGEMQRLQMEKIEELTLYIIELKKEIDGLKNKRP